MARPLNCRFVGQVPACTYYKPRGIPLSVLEQVSLTVDELEAVRLVDYQGLYQAQAAKKMNISRQTLGRILESAHKKIADGLVHGKAISIEGGAFQIASAPGVVAGPRRFRRGTGFGRRGPGRRHGQG